MWLMYDGAIASGIVHLPSVYSVYGEYILTAEGISPMGYVGIQSLCVHIGFLVIDLNLALSWNQSN
jgi:hypothetical protein